MIAILADVPINTIIKMHSNNTIYNIVYHEIPNRTFVSYWSTDGFLYEGFLWTSNYFLYRDFTILGTTKILEV